MIPFPFNENWFSFFVVADHLLVGQLCTNPKSDRSLLSCLKVTQCSTSEIGDAPQFKTCSLPIQVMITGPLPAPSKCKSGRPRITGTCPGWWKQSFRLRLWSRTLLTWPLITPNPAWSPPSTEYSPSSRRRLWERHAPSSGSVSRRWLRLKAATLNRC